MLSCPISLKQQLLQLLLMDLLLLQPFLRMLFRSLRSMIGCFTLNQVLLLPMPSSQALGALAAFSRNSWLIDSVASNHMTGDQHQFNNFTPCQSLSPITVADGSVSNVSGFGTVILPLLSLTKSYTSQNCHLIFFLLIKLQNL